jgi:aminoglycoside phosphotransferase (APT) family kinase protein
VSEPADPTGRWERREPLVALTDGELRALLRVAAPGRALASATPLTTGLVNTNYRIELEGAPAPVVLRVYTRDVAACARDERLLRLVAWNVPAPTVLYGDPDAAHFRLPWMLMSWVEGVPLPDALARLAADEAPSLAAALGATAAAIGAFSFPAPGFFAPDLTIAEPLAPPAEMTREHLLWLLFTGRAGERLGSGLTERLSAVIEARFADLDPLSGHTALVHADYRDSNIMVARGVGGDWRVTGVLDWEFAYAGPSLFDLGSLLRREATMLPPGFAAHVVTAYRAHGGFAPPGWRRMTLLMDLMNLCGFADMPDTRGAMLADVVSLVEATLTRLEDGEPDPETTGRHRD